ncbi:hypothetical protein SIL77_03230 [Exiguobacterium profundum]|uniref:hypothetical protein n=1 Tax=Exiguobacterium TaxID=33986 RepID=UPI001BA962ED|nr:MULTISPECIES: hypothetical protein [Exiguobacterium]MDX5980280.1 hypothetical protein [Exiguobacterium profundum]QUP87788.1 hypothetical protein KD909_03370 [Exiguobacterium sp. PFWT01]
MKDTDTNHELRSLRHTIDDLLILQHKTDSERLQQQLENERLQQNLTKHRRVIRNLRRQLATQQTKESYLTAALEAALSQLERMRHDD